MCKDKAYVLQTEVQLCAGLVALFDEAREYIRNDLRHQIVHVAHQNQQVLVLYAQVNNNVGVKLSEKSYTSLQLHIELLYS